MAEKVYFRKEIVSNPFIVAGKPVQFTALAGNRGYIELDPATDEKLITALGAAADNRKGGVSRISFEQAEELKKKYPSANSAYRSRPSELRPMPRRLNPLERSGVAGLAATKPKPISAAAPPPKPAAASAPPTPPTVSQGGATPSAPVAPTGPGFRPAVRRVSRTQPQAQAPLTAPPPETKPTL